MKKLILTLILTALRLAADEWSYVGLSLSTLESTSRLTSIPTNSIVEVSSIIYWGGWKTEPVLSAFTTFSGTEDLRINTGHTILGAKQLWFRDDPRNPGWNSVAFAHAVIRWKPINPATPAAALILEDSEDLKNWKARGTNYINQFGTNTFWRLKLDLLSTNTVN